MTIPKSIIDTPVDRVLRLRFVERLLALAEDWEEEAVQASLSGNPRRAHYLESYWAKKIRDQADRMANEPLIRALQVVGIQT